VPAPVGEQAPAPAPIAVSPSAMITLGSLVIATLVLGFYQGNFGHWLLGGR
jgi:hypothetical protein